MGQNQHVYIMLCCVVLCCVVLCCVVLCCVVLCCVVLCCVVLCCVVLCCVVLCCVVLCCVVLCCVVLYPNFVPVVNTLQWTTNKDTYTMHGHVYVMRQSHVHTRARIGTCSFSLKPKGLSRVYIQASPSYKITPGSTPISFHGPVSCGLRSCPDTAPETFRANLS